jgi:hypothetical protein
MAERITTLLFSVLIFGGIALAISYFIPHERIGSHGLPESPDPGTQETSGIKLGWTLFGLGIFGLLYFAFGVVLLVIIYGVAVLVFRHAFGIELPFGRFS